MAKAHKLTPLGVKNEKKPGYHLDGAGLILKVTPGGSRSWIHRYMRHGHDTWTGIGSYPEVSLAEARELVAVNRKKLRAGIDPLAEKQTMAATLKAERARAVTFDWCAERYITAHAPSWKNAKQRQQWENTLKTYASPTIGALDVARVETGHITKILEPIWNTKAETASRLRGRIESILDWATVKKHRVGENPARWKGHLEHLLSAPNKLKARHPALPFEETKSFMKHLREQAGIAARACEFTILTAARSGETRGATWSEIDEGAGLWIVPAHRMKGKREHRVPLSAPALAVLKAMREIKSGDLIFPGATDGKSLSDMSLTAVIRRMNEERTKTDQKEWRDRNGAVITMHGFRSTFRDWTGEATNHPNEMCELALAHAVSNKVEAAYRRGDMLKKRFVMMEDWATYCGCAGS